MPYLIEAVYLASGDAGIERVDRLLRKFGMPMGPFRLIDEVGGDVCQHVADDLLNRLSTKFPNSNTLRKMIEVGDLGKKSGRGFYKYSRGKSNGVSSRVPTGSLNITYTDDEIVDRLVLIMVNEAVRCLEEGVVESPKDVDFGMIMGTGWAPFRGGPISYLDSEGAKNVVDRLQKLTKKAKHFEPCDMLLEYAKKDKKFYEEK
jgi:3-hydroxyacyl-CoA dehydrogenase